MVEIVYRKYQIGSDGSLWIDLSICCDPSHAKVSCYTGIDYYYYYIL
jgi:hypothetical protein